MTKTLRTIPIAIATTLALLALPGTALAEYLVPEGNSAVTQYTEGFPTGGGEKKAGSSGGKKAPTPAQAIGTKNAKKLEDHGREGAEVAEVAAETAPENAGTPATTGSSGSGASNPGKSHPTQQKSGGKHKKSPQHKPKPDNSKQDEGKGTAPPSSSSGDGPSGSSGLGELLGTATGSSSGSLGLLLPLAILAAIAWGLTYFFRQRKRAEPATAAKP